MTNIGGRDDPNFQYYLASINQAINNRHAYQAQEIMHNELNSMMDVAEKPHKGKRGHFFVEHIPILSVQVGNWKRRPSDDDVQKPKLTICFAKKTMYVELPSSHGTTKKRLCIAWEKIEHIVCHKFLTYIWMLIVVVKDNPQIQSALPRTESRKTTRGPFQEFVEGRVFPPDCRDSKSYFRLEFRKELLKEPYMKILETYPELKGRQHVPFQLMQLWNLPLNLVHPQNLPPELVQQRNDPRQPVLQRYYPPQPLQQGNFPAQPLQRLKFPPELMKPPNMLPQSRESQHPPQFQQPWIAQMFQGQPLQQNHNPSSVQSINVQGMPSSASEQTSQQRDAYLPDPKRRRVEVPAGSTSCQRVANDESHCYIDPGCYSQGSLHISHAEAQANGQSNQDSMQRCFQAPGQGSFGPLAHHGSTVVPNQTLHANSNGSQMRPTMSRPVHTIRGDHMHTGGNITTPQSSTQNCGYNGFNVVPNKNLHSNSNGSQMRPNLQMPTPTFLGDRVQYSGVNTKPPERPTEDFELMENGEPEGDFLETENDSDEEGVTFETEELPDSDEDVE